MRARVQVKALLASARRAKRATPTKCTLAVLTGLRLQAEDEYLRVVGTNLQAMVEESLPNPLSEIQEPGAIVVPASLLIDKLGQLAKAGVDWVTLETVMRGQGRVAIHELIVTTDKGTTHLRGIDPAEFPVVPLGNQHLATVPGPELAQVVKWVALAANPLEDRPELRGVWFESSQDLARLFVVAENGHRLHYAEIPAQLPAPFQIGLYGMPLVAALLKGAAPITLALDQDGNTRYVSFAGARTRVIVVAVGATSFVDYRGFFPGRPASLEFAVPPLDLAAAIELVRCGNEVWFEADGTSLQLRVQDDQGEQNTAPVQTAQVGAWYVEQDLFRFALNPGFVVEALQYPDDQPAGVQVWAHSDGDGQARTYEPVQFNFRGGCALVMPAQ